MILAFICGIILAFLLVFLLIFLAMRYCRGRVMRSVRPESAVDVSAININKNADSYMLSRATSLGLQVTVA